MLSQQTRRVSPVHFQQCDMDGPDSIPQRREIEEYIHNSYENHYGADIQHFMPILLAIKDEEFQIRAALGLRPADFDRLYLENYLDKSVDNTLSELTGKQVSRNTIIEIGNLSMADRGSSRALIIAMSAFLYTKGYEWGVFTIGPLLANSFKKLGLTLTDLGPAIPERLLLSERRSWGSYYEQKPRIFATNIPDTNNILNQRVFTDKSLNILWEQAHLMGKEAA